MSDQFPENTLLAFEQAVEHGADRVDMDVHCTADDRLVVHHTYELGMTDDGEGLIFQHSAAHLRSLDAGASMAPRFAGELHADGYRVHAADCDSREDLEKAFALNVDQLSTVHVDLAREIRDSRLR